MGQVARWKRRYRKAKKATVKAKGWFTETPMSAGHKPKMVQARSGLWGSTKLSTAAKYPEPQWVTLESGMNVYGPVRDEKGGWGFFNDDGEMVYSKSDKIRDGQYTPTRKGIAANRRMELQKKYPVDWSQTPVKKKRIKMCGKKRSDGKKCRRRGHCPNHHDHLY